MRKIRFTELYRMAKEQQTPVQTFLKEASVASNRTTDAALRWARGERIPDRNVIENLAKRFDADPDYLFEPRIPRKK